MNKNTPTTGEDRPEPMEVDDDNRKHVDPRILLKKAKELENLLTTLENPGLVEIMGEAGEAVVKDALLKVNNEARDLREKAAERLKVRNSEKTAAWNRAEEAINSHLSVDGELIRKLMKRKVANDTEGGKPVERSARTTEETIDKINGLIDILETLKDELEDEQTEREEAQEEKKRARKENARKAAKKRKAKTSVAKSNESASDDEDDEEHFSLKRTRVVEAGAE